MKYFCCQYIDYSLYQRHIADSGKDINLENFIFLNNHLNCLLIRLECLGPKLSPKSNGSDDSCASPFSLTRSRLESPFLADSLPVNSLRSLWISDSRHLSGLFIKIHLIKTSNIVFKRKPRLI